MDVRTAPVAAPAPHAAKYRKDYRPPEWQVPEVRLRFTLDPQKTRVQASLDVRRNPDVADPSPLRLAGDSLVPIGVWIDGKPTDDWSMDGSDLVIPLAGDAHEIGIETELEPAANTKLMGLYASDGILCTQCEARASAASPSFPDRPDVLSAIGCG